MNKKFFPHTTLQAIVVILFIVVYTAIFIPFGKALLKNDEIITGDLINIIVSIALLSTIFTIYFINYKRKIKLSFNLKLENTHLLFGVIAIIILFEIGFAKPFLYVTNLFLHINTKVENPFQSGIEVIGTLLFTPILEEIIFRGIILKGLLTNHSPKKAIIISSIIFGLMHGPHFFIVLPIGLLFGWVYYKTKSLSNTIILHFIANTFALLAGYLNFKFGSKSFTNIYGEWSIYIIFVAIILLIILLTKMVKYIKTI